MPAWLYLSSYILLFGAELNSELEHQTATDTTAGASKPLGDRGAWAADHVAEEPTETEGAEAVPTSVPHGAGKRSPKTNAPSIPADFAAARLSTRVARTVGLKNVGMISSGVATIGLSLLRKRGQAAPGAALLAVAAASAWLTRERDLRE